MPARAAQARGAALRAAPAGSPPCSADDSRTRSVWCRPERLRHAARRFALRQRARPPAAWRLPHCVRSGAARAAQARGATLRAAPAGSPPCSVETPALRSALVPPERLRHAAQRFALRQRARPPAAWRLPHCVRSGAARAAQARGATLRAAPAGSPPCSVETPALRSVWCRQSGSGTRRNASRCASGLAPLQRGDSRTACGLVPPERLRHAAQRFALRQRARPPAAWRLPHCVRSGAARAAQARDDRLTIPDYGDNRPAERRGSSRRLS